VVTARKGMDAKPSAKSGAATKTIEKVLITYLQRGHWM